jgi:L-ascorbate metabolism protein UlaG (beta-lactamase superfamily)
MEITWYGHSCFRINERSMATVVTDPFDHAEIGYSELQLKADIVTVSYDAPGYNHMKAVKGSNWQITGPGEYEIGGVFLTGVPTEKKEKENNGRNMVYVFDYDGVTVAHLGNLTGVLNRKEVEALGKVDVLLVPVGGGKGLTAAKAAEVVNLIEPGIVVPMHYKTPDVKVQLGELNSFLKQMGISEKPKPEENLKVTSRDIPEETKVVVLSYSH